MKDYTDCKFIGWTRDEYDGLAVVQVKGEEWFSVIHPSHVPGIKSWEHEDNRPEEGFYVDTRFAYGRTLREAQEYWKNMFGQPNMKLKSCG